MEKLFVKIAKKLSKPYLISSIDLVEFLLEIREKIDGFDENFRCFPLLKDIKETGEEWFYSASKNDLIVLFDNVRNSAHCSGYLLEYFFPNLNKDFFDNLSK